MDRIKPRMTDREDLVTGLEAVQGELSKLGWNTGLGLFKGDEKKVEVVRETDLVYFASLKDDYIAKEGRVVFGKDGKIATISFMNVVGFGEYRFWEFGVADLVEMTAVNACLFKNSEVNIFVTNKNEQTAIETKCLGRGWWAERRVTSRLGGDCDISLRTGKTRTAFQWPEGLGEEVMGKGAIRFGVIKPEKDGWKYRAEKVRVNLFESGVDYVYVRGKQVAVKF